MQTEPTATNIFLRKNLPWLISVAAFVFYLFTLHRWLTPNALLTLPKVAGWDWQLMEHTPLYYLLTLPIGFLPVSWQTIALNLFSTVCAALTLGLLARSIRILPHDRTKDQRNLEHNDYSFLSIKTFWIPILLGVGVCAFQFTFWQNAISGTPEMLDLLLFAFVVRCLLEARLDPRGSWLIRACLVYGLAIPNNFAMIGFFPAFATALVWIKGMELFRMRRLLQMTLCLLLGMSLYLLIPAIHTLGNTSEVSFWESLRSSIGFQKHALVSFQRVVLLLISLTSLLPMIFIGVRWPASFGDISAAGNFLTNLTMHIIHGVFLAICIYVSFDPPFSPRELIKPIPYQLLPFYYLGALGIGYFAGYFLLVFSRRPARTWERPSAIRLGLGYVITALVSLGAFAVPTALFLHNRTEIVSSSSRLLYDYGVTAAKSLPKEGCVVLSDDLYRLYALAAALADDGASDRFVLVHSASLSKPGYHRHLSDKYPRRWTPRYLAEQPLADRIEPGEMLEAVRHLSQTSEIYYLHPSFGYYFEAFQQRPRHLVCELIPYQTNQVSGDLLSEAEIADNTAFWDGLYQNQLKALAEELAVKEDSPETFPIAAIMGGMYSRSLNYFGVELQKAGRTAEARSYFYRALDLNTNSASAYINLEFNLELEKGITSLPQLSKAAIERVRLYGGNWNAVLNANGPIDEPNNILLLASVLSNEGNYRQAAQLLERVIHFLPDNYTAQTGLSTMYTRAGFPEKGLEHVAYIKQHFKMEERPLRDRFILLQAEAWAYSKQGNMARAVELFTAAQKQYPTEPGPFERLAELYLDTKQFTSAMTVLENQMQMQPENDRIAIPYSWLKIQNGDHKDAVEILTRFLQKHPNDLQAAMNRALAYFMDEKMDDARRCYEEVVRTTENPPYQAFYGLAEIAWREERYEDARRHAEKYLLIAPPNSPEARFMADRLKLIRSRL